MNQVPRYHTSICQIALSWVFCNSCLTHGSQDSPQTAAASHYYEQFHHLNSGTGSVWAEDPVQELLKHGWHSKQPKRVSDMLM